ncbi:MAG: MFS transporter [Patescibacteria group bacterium]
MKKKKKTWKDRLILKEINPVIRLITLSDIMILGGYGLISPIFAVFVTYQIRGGSVETAGIAMAIYAIAQSAFQIPVGILIDKIKGERDDFFTLFFGSLVFSIVPLFYLIVHTPMELYIVQFFYGLATATTLPAWYAIFTRHIDKKHEGIEWGAYRTLVDVGGGIAALLGGYIAYHYSFAPLFMLVSLTSLIGTAFLLGIYRHMKPGKIF